MVRSVVGMLMGIILATTAGCTAQHQEHAIDKASVVYQTASTPAPSWVFGPSAPLPTGYPKPGPVGEILIKQYPPSRIALVDGKDRRNNSRSMFMPLFHHIEDHHIAMSSPVVMTYQESVKDQVVMSSMAFVYPSDHTGQLEKRGEVQVVDVPAMMVVSIGVRGGYNASRFLKATGKIYLWLSEHKAQFASTGEPRYLAYNSPFVPSLFQYGEVQIPVHQIDPMTPVPNNNH